MPQAFGVDLASLSIVTRDGEQLRAWVLTHIGTVSSKLNNNAVGGPESAEKPAAM